MITCAECGHALPLAVAVNVCGYQMHEECRANVASKCCECGEWMHNDDAVKFDGSTYCAGCDAELAGVAAETLAEQHRDYNNSRGV